MGYLVSSFFISFSSNIDNFAVGIAYGAKKIKIGILSNLNIAIFSANGAFLSMSIGEKLGRLLSAELANLLGFIALLSVGLWGLWDTFRFHKKEILNQKKPSGNQLDYTIFIEKPETADLDNSHFIDVRESLTLALALTINNVAGGFGAGLSGLNIPVTTFLTLLFSLLAIEFGYFMGKKFTSRISAKWSGIISASLIICLAVYEYFI
ncbi:sporulation membrane protein YtaF [Nostoc sp.]|uniref:sporulation membrane protein YtaF n=1 Tax=Nostoc sp. TaxID=1180 RepID=UPI002FF9CA33